MADMSGVISTPSDWRLMLGGHSEADARYVYEPTRVCQEGQYFRLEYVRRKKGVLGPGDIGEFVTTDELVFNRNMPFLRRHWGICSNIKVID